MVIHSDIRPQTLHLCGVEDNAPGVAARRVINAHFRSEILKGVEACVSFY